MSSKAKPWRRADKKHFKHKLKFVKGKKPPVKPPDPKEWPYKIDIP